MGIAEPPSDMRWGITSHGTIWVPDTVTGNDVGGVACIRYKGHVRSQ